MVGGWELVVLSSNPESNWPIGGTPGQEEKEGNEEQEQEEQEEQKSRRSRRSRRPEVR